MLIQDQVTVWGTCL